MEEVLQPEVFYRLTNSRERRKKVRCGEGEA